MKTYTVEMYGQVFKGIKAESQQDAWEVVYAILHETVKYNGTIHAIV